MRTLHTAASRPYDISHRPRPSQGGRGRSRRINCGVRVLLVSDSNVAPLYADTVAESYAAAGYRVTRFVFPAGEESKRLSTIAALYEQLAADGLTRADLIAALGGGVTGDMAGFAAATWLRGDRFCGSSHLPPRAGRLLGGGKPAWTSRRGKTWSGPSGRPAWSWPIPTLFPPLPADILSDGMAEVVKAACIKDASFFHWLSRQDALSDENLPETVSRAVDIKRRVVESDEREAGERRLLNFGHTLGHALKPSPISACPTAGRWRRDDARHPRRRAEGADGTWYGGGYRRIAAPVRPARRRRNPARRIPPLRRPDKKRAGDSLSLVLLHRIGDGYIHPIPADSLPAFVAEPYRK